MDQLPPRRAGVRQYAQIAVDSSPVRSSLSHTASALGQAAATNRSREEVFEPISERNRRVVSIAPISDSRCLKPRALSFGRPTLHPSSPLLRYSRSSHLSSLTPTSLSSGDRPPEEVLPLGTSIPPRNLISSSKFARDFQITLDPSLLNKLAASGDTEVSRPIDAFVRPVSKPPSPVQAPKMVVRPPAVLRNCPTTPRQVTAVVRKTALNNMSNPTSRLAPPPVSVPSPPPFGLEKSSSGTTGKRRKKKKAHKWSFATSQSFRFSSEM